MQVELAPLSLRANQPGPRKPGYESERACMGRVLFKAVLYVTSVNILQPRSNEISGFTNKKLVHVMWLKEKLYAVAVGDGFAACRL